MNELNLSKALRKLAGIKFSYKLKLGFTKSQSKLLYTRQNSGFTLLELITVVVIAGILAAIMAPGWLTFVNRQRLNKANDAVLAAIQEVQRQAKTKKRKYNLSLKLDNNVPLIATYSNDIATSVLTSSQWQPLGHDLGIKAEKFRVGTNLTATNQGGNTVTAVGSTPVTITFDYTGNLPVNSTTPLKVVVAIPTQQGNTIQDLDVKQCVIVKTLLGAVQTGKNTECN